MRKCIWVLCLVGLLAFVSVGYSAPTHYLYYAGGAIADAGAAIPADGTLSTDNAVFSVLVADVEFAAGSVTISNWRAAGQLPTTHPTSSSLLSWMYMGADVNFYDGKLYVGPGDWNADTSRDTADFVAWAPINTDGSLGTFQLSSEFPSPPADQAICTSAIVDFGGGNAYLYVMGGTNAYTTRVLKSKIQPDGSLGAWTSDTPLLAGMWFNRAVVSGTTIINGYGHPETLDRRIITAAPSSTDGSISAWTDRGLYDTTAEGRWDYAMTTVIGIDFPPTSPGTPYLVIAGGNSTGSYVLVDTVNVAPLTGGVPGTWTVASPLSRACRGLTAASVGNFVIIPGGATSGAAAGTFNDIFVGAVNASGNVTWTTSATPMLRAQGFGGAVIVDRNDLPQPPTPTPTPFGFAAVGSADWMLYE
jgi:hypothetical protein